LEQRLHAADVRSPSIEFKTTGNAIGVCPGYDGTDYSFESCNFAPKLIASSASPVASGQTDIPLDQFGTPNTANEVFITINAGQTGRHMWNVVV
jgi:hypothetical protein